MTLTTITLVWLAYSTIGGIISAWFLYTWGWGDASWGDKTIHPGTPNDLWHRRRRRAFYAVAIWAVCGNPVALIFLAFEGRKIFRSGVWVADNGMTHRRWYG